MIRPTGLASPFYAGLQYRREVQAYNNHEDIGSSDDVQFGLALYTSA